MIAWTREQPTQPGWYWFRGEIFNLIQVVRIEDSGHLVWLADGTENPHWVRQPPDGWWAGPLEPPSGKPWKESGA